MTIKDKGVAFAARFLSTLSPADQPATSSVGGEVIGLLRVIILKNKLVVPGRVELPTHPCEGYVITVSPQN